MPAAGGIPAAEYSLIFADKIGKFAQLIGAIGTAELQESFFLDLAYPLPGHLKYLSDLLQSVFLAAFVQAVAHSHDLLLPRRQRLKRGTRHLPKIMLHHVFVR